ncbi:hypothetical protein [Mucisphaera calidilacus]|uniref:PEP-CTERM sorting domain-containing protein n=1 Tax=Mucisphaera calidilacus TaxID=2527982 RepID=A0A518C116_9BACT|nr:hypothetical protein [Mucisphaera calidilacus]QDU72884.1 hypothetical protein Pan265_27600 [Mucisphaera calidilacus]
MRSISTLAAVACMAAPTLAASSYTTDFENFSLGSDTTGSNPLITDPAAGSNNWRGNGSSGLADNGVPGSQYDGEIADTGTSSGKAYRLSNAKVSGNYDTTHASTPTVDAVGETGTIGTPGTFSFSFDFRSVLDTVQEGLSIDVTPFQAGTASRQGILRFTDDGTDGLSVGWWEVDNGSFNFIQLATGLARDAWHSVEVDMTFIDGLANDLVSIDLNGSVTSTTTWETYSGYNSPVAIDSVIFRVVNPVDFSSNTGGVAALDDGGLYFDNLSVSAAPAVVPTPAAFGAGMIGLLAVATRRGR